MNQSPQKPKTNLTGNPSKVKLTKKQAVFVKELLDNPKQSATQAAMIAYGKPNKDLLRNTAKSIATENLSKPAIRMALGEANDLLESTLLNTIKDWGREDNTRKREIAQNAVMYAHDKVHGRATQRVEQHTTGITLNLDLSGLAEATEPTQSTS